MKNIATLLMLAISALLLSGCAIAPMPDGSGYCVGTRMSGNGTSAQEVGGAVGGTLTALGVPGGAQIGTLLGGALGILGIGVAAHKSGKETGWDERQAAATPHPITPPAAQGTTT